MGLQITQFDYHLPTDLIAQHPAEPRDASRLLVIDRQQHQIFHRASFRDLLSELDSSTVLVRNNTKVLPARLLGQLIKPNLPKSTPNPVINLDANSTGRLTEILLLKKINFTAQQETWECLTKPGLKPGQVVQFSAQLTGTCQAITDYTRVITFNQSQTKFLTTLSEIGHTPIPPYIHWQDDDEVRLRQAYQTVYAQIEGSVAAPTAGLHFTPRLIQELTARGIKIVDVTLHVGLGTFLPVKTADVDHHQMHQEWFEITPAAAQALNQAKQAGQKILALGTTTTRVLETMASDSGELSAGQGETAIFIKPGYRFKFVNQLLTNFHLPKSTLLMLVSALVSQPNTTSQFTDFGSSLIGLAYQQAIDRHYRFYSFGDAMLIK